VTAKHIQLGWSKPGDDIPQPTSIVMGANLRKPSPTLEPKHAPFGLDLSGIAKWIEDRKEDSGSR
jgi:hypothetical protein